jgi:hypothetical protein
VRTHELELRLPAVVVAARLAERPCQRRRVGRDRRRIGRRARRREQVHAERAGRHRAQRVDVIRHLIDGAIARRQEAQSAGLAHRPRERGGRRPARKRRLHDRMLEFDQREHWPQ